MLKGNKLHFFWAAYPTHSMAGRDLSWRVCLTFIYLIFLFGLEVKLHAQLLILYDMNSKSTELQKQRG